jgi:peptide/nickel transport system substrate-binding protein
MVSPLFDRQGSEGGVGKAQLTRRDVLALAAFGLIAGTPRFASAAGPAGQLTWGIHVSLAPTWFDPAETPALITPFMIMYALHDAMVKPLPGQPMAPSLAESWSAAEDGRSYDFVLRKGATFHNGDPITAEDVKYSFTRYRGASHSLLHDRVETIETPDPQHVRFHLKAPWPDFLTFYAASTGAGWIVPKKYVEKVGEDGFKKAPVGAGPYKFVSFNPGVELVLEACDQYWRKTPSVKRLVFRSIPEESTRLAALKGGEVDVVYAIRGELADDLRRTPGLKLQPVNSIAPFWLYFADQWNPKSPWYDERVRRAANLAIDRQTINEALTLGYSKLTNSLIPASFEFYWQPPPPVHDPVRAKQLLAEAGHPRGFDAGEYYCDSSWASVGEAVLNNLQEVGIRSQLRPIERAAFLKGWGEKAFKNLIQCGSGAFGNTATRLDAFIVKGGTYVYGSYPDIDALAPQQAAELDNKRRAAILEKMQQLVYEKSVVAPIWQLAFINGTGPRVGESGFGLITDFAYTAPYEDITIKGS